MNPSLLVVALVDDDIYYRTRTRIVLERVGITMITEFEDAASALTALRKQRFHLVVTDNSMPPGMPGIVLIDEIRQEHGKAVECILLTGEADNEALQSLAKRRGAPVVGKSSLGADLIRGILRDLFPD